MPGLVGELSICLVLYSLVCTLVLFLPIPLTVNRKALRLSSPAEDVGTLLNDDSRCMELCWDADCTAPPVNYGHRLPI